MTVLVYHLHGKVRKDLKNLFPGEDNGQRKYHNQRTVHDGITFDSLKEADRYEELKLKKKAGLINSLIVHPGFDMSINGVHICRFVPDFAYVDSETGKKVIEDVKSKPTITRAYVMKKRLLKAIHGLDVREF